ncbi:conserved hypothetical protein, unlikely [Trypanosoma brucei gambiense DAL972]|uniref:T. brucei spp.-specific protein n=1 Tax=Trypanosoma brucei gambiense (strain MHOM/CI/86/DAL972) TaxID=679716 RepID=C9ZZ93_TRYB9|nr:conserved hypothetical protein, unlikely [Trypanosoma brucei gambiense DAL972]CBH14742.1 conserved hypothetical protein, unlikely [Trypanosoma brucei gambiense DAL972]|eukprot:XP_011777008.1 conserved hypothetical protein, unlikely [Trypanosoma brucei gambiense DAL972]
MGHWWVSLYTFHFLIKASGNPSERAVGFIMHFSCVCLKCAPLLTLESHVPREHQKFTRNILFQPHPVLSILPFLNCYLHVIPFFILVSTPARLWLTPLSLHCS